MVVHICHLAVGRWRQEGHGWDSPDLVWVLCALPLGYAFVGWKQHLFRVIFPQAVKPGTETELGDGVGSEGVGDSAETQSDKVLQHLPEGEAFGAEGG